MGSSGSKAASSSSHSSTTDRRGRSRGNRVFQSFCLQTSTSSSHDIHNDDQVCDHQKKENGNNATCINPIERELDLLKNECGRKVRVEQSDEMPCISSNTELDEWGQENIARTTSRTPSCPVRSSSMGSFNPSSRFLSRFSFIPGNVSFRLSRATSLGSSRAYPVPSTSLTILNNEEELLLRAGPAGRLGNRNETQQGDDLLHASLINRSHTQCYGGSSGNLQLNTPESGSSDNLREGETLSSIHDVAGEGDNSRTGADVNLVSPRIHTEMESIESRLSDRRPGAREPVERNFRFSRTLSVGRLRDRVLRRSSLSDLTLCPLQQEREVRDASQGSERQNWGNETRELASEVDAITSPTAPGYTPSSMSGAMFSTQDNEVESSRSREGRYHDLLEHRSHFLERRRRIRSQVRALQRLGSRFENLSGHERSCILSGQHRTGRCTCRIRDANSNDDTSARASISRIVMLAEALFEVLDEIHQQSVVLSSHPSESSIGSVPAPNEVVESLPVKFYSKAQKYQNDEAAQCYICLGEYEEGDDMRILPCNHEFHRTCIDKWLKEIHRVCPLCRGDICRSDPLPAEN